MILSHKHNIVIVRYLIATIGLFFVAMGIALSINTNLGTSPLSCPAYVMEGVWGLTVGNWTILINMLYLVIQVVVLRKRFKLLFLTQILATVVFGYLIDFSLFIIQWLQPVGMVSKLAILLVACFISAIGISTEVLAKAWMLSAEMTVYAFTKVTKAKFNNIKIIMDSSLVVISALLAYLMHGNWFGFGEYDGLKNVLLGNTEGIVIGLGTLIMAIMIGWMMKITDPIVDKFIDKVIFTSIYKRYEE